MIKSDIDVRNLMYDPWSEKTVKKLEAYEEFAVDFGISKEQVVAYIILMYDMNSPLRKEIPYFNQRKLMAAELAGFKKDKDGKFKADYEAIILGQNGLSESAISKYIRLFASPKYLALVYYWSILSLEFSNITSASESKDLKNTIANIEKLEAKINECTDILFGGDDTMNIKRALYESVEKENLKLTPEAIANADDIDDLIGNPYGEDYKFEKIKFKGSK